MKNFFLWIVRTWMLIRAVEDAEPGKTIQRLKEQLHTNRNLRKLKAIQDKEAKLKRLKLKQHENSYSRRDRVPLTNNIRQRNRNDQRMYLDPEPDNSDSESRTLPTDDPPGQP